MKTCTMCGEERQLDWYCKGSGKDGLSPWCRPCRSAYKKDYRERNPDKAYVVTPEQARSYQLKAKYNITAQQYDEMLSAQGGRCAVCPAVASEGTRQFHVDHDHACCPGKFSCGQCIRGILCGNCNVALGMLGDNVATLEKLISYLTI